MLHGSRLTILSFACLLGNGFEGVSRSLFEDLGLAVRRDSLSLAELYDLCLLLHLVSWERSAEPIYFQLSLHHLRDRAYGLRQTLWRVLSVAVCHTIYHCAATLTFPHHSTAEMCIRCHEKLSEIYCV